MQSKLGQFWLNIGVCLLIVFVSACGKSEEDKKHFLSKAKTHYEQGEYRQSRLALTEAIQKDQRFVEAYYLLGLLETREKKFNEAKENFVKVLELSPNHENAHLQMGKLSLVANNLDNVIERAALVLQLNPDNNGAKLLRIAALLVQNTIAQEQQLLREVFNRQMSDEVLYRVLAAEYRKEKEFYLAEALLKHGITAQPNSKIIPIALADLYWDTDRKTEALGLINGGKLQGSETEEELFALATFFITKNHFVDGQMILQEGIRLYEKTFQLRLLLSDLHMRQGKRDDALNILIECLALDQDQTNPSIIQANNSLANIYLLNGNINKAQQHINAVLDANPENAEAHFSQGELSLATGDSKNAIQEFQLVISQQPGFIPGYLRLAKAHILEHEPDAAMLVLQDAIQEKPKSREARRALARLHGLKQNYKEAEDLLRALLIENPADLATRADLGDLFLALRDYQGAKTEYLEIRQRDNRSPLSYQKFGQLYVTQQQLDKAIGEYEAGYEKNPRSGELLSALVRLYSKTDQFDKAIALCEKKIASDPDDAVAYNLLAEVYTLQNEYGKAEETLLKAIELRPEWQAPRSHLAKIKESQKETSEIVKSFESSESAQSQDTVSAQDLKLFHKWPADTMRRRQTYEKAVKTDPSDWKAANNLAFLLSEHAVSAEELHRARSLAQHAQELKPDDANILDTLGWVHYKMGSQEQALTILEKAYAQTPDRPVINYHLGMVLYKMGRVAEAKDKLTKAVQSNENYTGKQEALQILNQP